MTLAALRRHTRWLVPNGLMLAALTALAATPPAHAGEATEASAPPVKGWEIRFYAAAVDMEQGSTELTEPTTFHRGFDSSAGGGIGFNAEYRFSRRLGLDLGLFSGGNVDIETYTHRGTGNSWVSYDTLTFTPLTAGLDIHLTPDERVDVYFCPMVALVQYGSIAWYDDTNGFRSEVDFDEDFALGARLGVGVPFGESGWSFQANITYLDGSLEGRGANGVRVRSGLDSTMIGFGAGFRFKRLAG